MLPEYMVFALTPGSLPSLPVRALMASCGASMATEMIKGKPLSEALTLTNKAVAEALDGLPAYKMHCSVLAEEAIKRAIKDYYDKNGIEYDKTQFPADEDCDHCAMV